MNEFAALTFVVCIKIDKLTTAFVTLKIPLLLLWLLSLLRLISSHRTIMGLISFYIQRYLFACFLANMFAIKCYWLATESA
jgi:hypothetical protein